MPLSHYKLRRLYKLASRVDLDRDALLEGIDERFVASLSRSGGPSVQILRDLVIMNSIERLPDGTTPLTRWLENAVRLSALRTERRSFQKFLAESASRKIRKRARRTVLDDTGLLVAKRHLMTDLTLALLSAGPSAPLSVAFLDMNGLKMINDTYGHPVGDEAIRTFFQAVLATLGQKGEAYRNGGDEVVVILPGVSDNKARKLLEKFVQQLGRDALLLGDSEIEEKLTASCGSASTTDPREDAMKLLQRADNAEIRAKNGSRERVPRVSAIAVGEGEVVTYATKVATPRS